MDAKQFPVIPSERSDDLHNPDKADASDLNLFMAGNQFMVMPELIAAFQRRHADIQHIYYETLPPGLELKQILAGGALFRGAVLDVQADVYASVSEKGMQALEDAALIETGGYAPYLRNRLTLMVPAGNPANIRSVADLGREDVRISQPDPTYEDIAVHIMNMYRQAGGEDLVRRIMTEKRAGGTTILTVVHHRETPLRIRKKTADVGPVWATEAVHAATTDLAFDVIEPGEALDQRQAIRYYICRLSRAPHPENAEKFIRFIQSPEAQAIYKKFGFLPHDGREKE